MIATLFKRKAPLIIISIIFLSLAVLAMVALKAANSEELIEVTIDTVDPLGQHLDGGELNTARSTPFTQTRANGGQMAAFVSSGGLVTYNDQGFVFKDATYWVDALTHVVIRQEATPGTTKINVVFPEGAAVSTSSFYFSG